MNKYTKIMAAGTLALSILPFAASAHGNSSERGQSDNVKTSVSSMFGMHLGHEQENDGDQDEMKMEMHAFPGTVTAVAADSFTLSAANGNVYTVNTANAKISQPFGGVIALSAIKVNDKVVVKGSLNGTTITAKSVLDMPANTHPAATVGKVTAISGSTITLQNTHTGVVSNVTVNTSANTQVTKDGQPATTADIAVGSTIRVKGLWDETLNVLNAIKISIRNLFGK